MKRPLAVLHIEDAQDDSVLLRHHLTRAGYDVTMERVDTPEQMQAAIDSREWDVIISDYVMPRFSALSALAIAKQRQVDVPFIILSGAIGEETAVSAMRAGAHDYLMKDKLARLVPAIEREMQEAAHRRDHRRAEAALRNSEKLATLGRLAATIAHEVNNPLEAVTNVVYLLSRLDNLDQTAREYVNIAQKELERVTHIVRQALGFTRGSTGPESIEVAALIDNVLELYKPKIESAGLTIERRYDYAGTICGIAPELRQVLSNLVINAVHATPRGGRVVVRTRKTCRYAGERTDGVCIVVADTGSGIGREHMAHVFEPFYTTKGSKGTGLGLWVSNSIVASHNGSIRVRSSICPGRSGTVFSIFLPLEVTAERDRSMAAHSSK